MSESIIIVQNLSKRYKLRAYSNSRSRYNTLRDVMVDKLKSVLRPKDEYRQQSQDYWALKNVSFSIKEGEIIGILGRNGAGKSTLLKILSRVTEPTEGRIELKGRVSSLLEVGTGFHPELTGQENVFLNGAILGMTRLEIKRRFDEIVAFADVEKFLNTPVKHYSSGMYMRLAFAVAAHLESEILVVDEVLAVGDAAFQKKCLGKMQDVSQSGRTVLFVSHNLDALARLCSSCLYLVGGELKLKAETNEAIKAYTSSVGREDEEIDLRNASRIFESTPDARLLSVRMHIDDENRNSYWSVEYARQLGFILSFSVSKPLENPEIGYQIFAPSGAQLVASTTLQEKALTRLEPGHYSLSIKCVDLTLNPGKYTVGFSVRNDYRNIDCIAEAAAIEVTPNAKSVERGLHEMWAPITPCTTYGLSQN